MSTVMDTAKRQIARHRLPLMKYCLAAAVICSLISLSAQQFNNNLLPLALTLIINLIFLFGMDLLILKALRNQTYTCRDFAAFGPYLKKLVPLFGIYLILLGAGVFLIQLLSRSGGLILILPGILAVSVIFLNCINHLTLFAIIQNHENALSALKQGIRMFVQSKKLILHIVLKTILLVLLGSLAVYAVNVFVYAPQIDAAMKAAPEITEALIDPYFSTNLSYMIQSVGMQLVVSYIAIVSGMTYGVYFLKRSSVRLG